MRRPKGSKVKAISITLPEWALRRLELAVQNSSLTKNKLASRIIETFLNPQVAGTPLMCPRCKARFSVMAVFKAGGCPSCKLKKELAGMEKPTDFD